ncbi:MAG: hypothetical protein Q4C47_01625 [Planctomycetia bacterium]|nr:hypothetical protein [Planctomycetia bacterium]
MKLSGVSSDRNNHPDWWQSICADRGRRRKLNRLDTIKKGGMGRSRFTEQAILRAIRGSSGLKTVVAGRLGCSRTTLDRYLDENETLRVALGNEREDFKDLIESRLRQGILEGNTAMIIFAAKTLCRDRGYVTRTEVSDTRPIVNLEITQNEDEALE